ncbi:hypothetical protein BDD12DRAFT_808471 [Trichophaea hybrida]|nr:hypothetical protein BDD12DRAFT_808471 [Trichophaea hybrida]
MLFPTPGRLATYAAELESNGNPFCLTSLERPFFLPLTFLINKATVLTECTRKSAPLPTPPPSEPSEPTVIERLIAANSDVWEKLMNNQFCKLGFTSSAAEFDNIYRAFAKVPPLFFLPLFPRSLATARPPLPRPIRSAVHFSRVPRSINSHACRPSEDGSRGSTKEGERCGGVFGGVCREYGD